jgi:hypothetical protein
MPKLKYSAVQLVCELDLAGWPFIRLLIFDDNRCVWVAIDQWHGLEANAFVALAESMSTFERMADYLITSAGVERELPFP